MTVKAVGLGWFPALVFGAANAYLGMKADRRWRRPFPRPSSRWRCSACLRFAATSSEQNITRTAASVGEAPVTGAIFTIHAFMMVDINGVKIWSGMRERYWQASFSLLAGGLIGVFIIILLRRALVIEAGLPFPESVASAEIVRAVHRRMSAGDCSGADYERHGIPALGGYLVGLVGSSNQPLRGLTLPALLICAPAAVLGVAAVVAVACSVLVGIADPRPAGRAVARRHSLEDAAGRSNRSGAARLLPDGSDPRAASGERRRRRNRRAITSRAAGRPHGPACERDRGRPDGVGPSGCRRNVRSRVDPVGA
jgi:uncharacterized oligopeptide transporter (OPT) family protein